MGAVQKKRMSRVFNAFMAVALALLMVPVVPGSAQPASADEVQATDWQVSERDESGFVKTVVFDQYGDDGSDNPAFTETISDDQRTALEGESTVALEDSAAQSLMLSDATARIGSDEINRDDGVREAVKATLGDVLAAFLGESSNKADMKAEALDAWLAAGDNESGAKTKAKKAAEDAVRDKLAADGVEYEDLEITLTDDSWSIDPASGDFAVKDSSVSVANGALNGTPTVSNPQYSASDYEISSVASLNGGIVEASALSGSSFSLTATGSGSTELEYGFSCTPVIVQYDAAFEGTCDGSFDTAVLSGWKYRCDYTFSYHDKDSDADVSVTSGVPDMEWISGADYDYALADAKYADVTSASEIALSNLSKTFSGVELKDGEINGTVKRSIEVVDLFPASFAVDGNALQGIELTYNGDDVTREPFAGVRDFVNDAARAHALSVLEFKSDDSEYAELTYKDGTLFAKPVHATDAEKSVGVTWTHGSLPSVSANVTLTVEKCEITALEDVELDFRVMRDNESEALAAANDAVCAAVEMAEKNAGKSYEGVKYYSNVSFDDSAYYGTLSAAHSADPTWVVNKGDDNTIEDNYVVPNPDVKIKAMQTPVWDETALTLNANDGIALTKKHDAEDKWIKQVPKATESGHTLAYATGVPQSDELFAAEKTLSGGDGIHSVEIYDRDNETRIVRRITGVSYKLDTLAPVLTGAEASTPKGKKSVKGDTELFGEDSVKVELTIADELKGNEKDSADKLNQIQSLVVEKETSVGYYDSEGNKDVQPKLDIEKLNDYVSVYSFNLAENEDVATKSIKVHAVDNAGNVLDTTANQSRDIPIKYTRLVAEADAPQVSVSWSNNDVRNGRYYAADRTMTITVVDKFFNYIQDYANDQVVVTVAQNGETVIAVHPSDFQETSRNSNTWTYSLAFTADSDWEVSGIRISDIIGRTATASGDSFTIDKVAPTMDVVFDNDNATNGMYYNAGRTATITVNEHNFLEGLVDVAPTASAGNGDSAGQPVVSGWTSDGDVRTATVGFPTDGVYTLTVSGTDGASNPLPTYTASEFTIDTTQPTIEISGVDNLNAFASGQSAQPNVVVHDTNVSAETTVTIEKISYPIADDDANPYLESRSETATDVTVSYPDAGETVQNDGVYTLNVQATDMAGNSDSQAITWSVNRFGSTYVLSEGTQDMIDGYVKPEDVVDVQVTEINPSGYGDEGSTVEMTRDTKNTTLALNDDYSIESSGSGWSSYAYDVFKKNFASDGAYQLLLHSNDRAGNTSENTMKNKDASRSKEADIKFFVDGENPICSFIDLADGGVYNEPEHKAQVRIEDNMELDRAVVKVGDETIDLSSEDLANTANHEVTLLGSADKQSVSVVAYDAAGNASELMSVEGITVTTDPVVLWVNNTPLFIGTIVGGLAVVGAAAALLFVRLRRRGM